ncbi:MAG TPA: hypothetical protein VK183_04670 [Flavobacterium sp.]|nr:hypothetical protein [Flavobacterium sp.]
MIGKLKKHIVNVKGPRLSGRFLVLESDDWGSIRIPGPEQQTALLRKGLISAADPFSRYDTLETADDFLRLREVLTSVRDLQGRPAVLTANTVMANPDFDAIRATDFRDYHYQRFDTTYEQYGEHQAFSHFQEGIKEGTLFPQFHAREHLNVPLWMRLLQDENAAFRQAFDLKCFSIDYKNASNRRANLMAAFDCDAPEDRRFVDQSIADGLELFERVFGFPSASAIAPCYVWDSGVETVMQQNGVSTLQGSKFQFSPQPGATEFQRIYHYNGQRNNAGQTYLSRNGLFEPSLNRGTDWVDKAMESIGIAFAWGKPAVIGTHRINFAGRLDRSLRDENLDKLGRLLRSVQKKWPDVQFVDSATLAQQYGKRT